MRFLVYDLAMFNTSPGANNMIYIQRKDANGLETVDEFETRKEAKDMLNEYRMADPYASYYISSRPCKAWANK